VDGMSAKAQNFFCKLCISIVYILSQIFT